jgi:uncharacterized protein (TIGR02391 family)
MPAPRPRLSEADSVGEDQAISQAYELLIDDEELRTTTQALFRDGHWAQSVEEGFKYVNNLVKHRSGLAADGADLMRRALSLKDPTLKLSDLKTQSQKDQQLGYMEILAGVMTGVRNPRAHEHRYLEDPRIALELLCLAIIFRDPFGRPRVPAAAAMPEVPPSADGYPRPRTARREFERRLRCPATNKGIPPPWGELE